MSSSISTQVLDIAAGKPAAGIPITLERKTHTAGWQSVASAITDVDGRVKDLVPKGEVFLPGHYRLVFETGPYFLVHESDGFFPQVSITFVVKDPGQDYHVPLLLSPYGYSTYRGK